MEEFSIELGAKLKLDSLQEQINKASSNLKPLEITINTEKSEKKITALTEQISKLNNGFKIMENMGLLSSNLDVINKSLRSIATVIDKINKADGFNNLGKGLSSFAPVAEMIKNELSSIKTAMESFKGVNLNIGFGSTNNKTASDAANRMALAELRQQESALESAYGGFINMAKQLNSAKLWNFKNIADDATASMPTQIQALRQYINAILEINAASAKGIDLTSVTSKFSGSADEIVTNTTKIATGEKALVDQTNQLKGLFGSGIDAEKLTTQLDTIKVSIDNVSTAISGIKFDDSTLNSFENTIQSLNNVVNQLNQSINTLNNNPLIPKTDNLLNNNLPQQMEQSGNNAGQQFANGFNRAINGIDLHNGGVGHVNGMLQQLGFDRDSLKVITENLGNMKLHIDSIKTTMLSSGDIRITVTGTDELLRSVQIVRDFDKETGNVINTSKSFIQNFAQQETQIQRNTTAITNYTTKLEKLRKDYEDKNAPKPIQDESHLKRLNDLRTAAINQVNALNTANKENYSSMDALAKQAISNLETEIRLLRNEEYAANQLRAKPIETIKAEQVELLRKFRAEIEASGIAFNKFKAFNIGQLSGKVNGIIDKQSLMDYLNSFSVAQTEFKALQAEQKNYSQMQKASADKEKAALKEVENEYQNLISLVGQIGKLRVSLIGLDSEKDSQQITTIKSKLQELFTEYSRNKMNFAMNFPTHGLDEINAKWKEILYNIQLSKSKTADTMVGKSHTSMFNELSRVSKEMDSIQIKLQTLKSSLGASEHTEQIKELEKQLENLKTIYQEVMNQINNNGGLTDSQYAKLYTDIEMLDAKLKEISASAIDAQNKLKNTIKDNISNGTLNNQIQTLENDYRKLGLTEDQIAEKVKELKSLLSTMDASDDIETVTRDYAAFGQEVVKAQNDVKALRREQQKAKDEANLANKKTALTSQIDLMFKKYSAAIPQFGARLQQIKSEIASADGIKLTNLQREVQDVKRQMELAGKATMSFGDKLKSKLGSLATYFSATMMISYAIRGIRSMFQNVLQVDTAMTELYRVTDLTEKQYSQLYDKMVAGAKKYNAALNDVISATAEWVRFGFDANLSEQLAELTVMYQHVTDLDHKLATENLLTAYKGFQPSLDAQFDGDAAAAVEHILDVYDKLNNELPVSAAQIAEGVNKTASVLEEAGATFEQASALIVGGGSVTQDFDAMGNSIKIATLRIHGMKGKLEELGEEVDENIQSVSKIQTQILNLTHGKVNIFEDDGEHFRNIYDVFKDIASVWDSLSDTESAELLELIAGIFYQNVQRCA